jgi:hypothetical protein
MRIPAEYQELFVRLIQPTLPRVIGFHALAGTGKSTFVTLFSHFLGQEGIVHARIPFAWWLKTFCRTKLGIAKTPALVEDEVLQQRARKLWQIIGTDLLRDEIDPDFHVNRWKALVQQLPEGVLVLVEDVRFPNEAEAIRSLGGVVVKLTRPGVSSVAGAHKSEQGLPEELVDVTLTLPELSELDLWTQSG